MNVEELAAALTDTRLLSNATLADAAALLLEQQATITELRATRDEVVDELAEARATIDRLTAERDDVKLDHVREVIDHERTILTLEAERKLADDLAIDLQLALQYTDEVDASASLAAWRVARSSTPTPVGPSSAVGPAPDWMPARPDERLPAHPMASSTPTPTDTEQP